ncbi:hypothetical protein K435DRAFT_674877 [Dendrothele bispora CBS 962.96]|uniref:Uncharacterized protein n=1 Tax=Dendrothele bispora (strain CBS 962.96) TaxID=1314807 RepID=A0A4S8LNX8_DENBC|nr:hypothetical protein K435DRAFT_674877 [Dendrothele bispora CBS 962.96]
MPGTTVTSNYSHWIVLGVIQSHVLLAQYYFLTGRKLEGRYSVTIAIALVLGMGMHHNHTSGVFLSGSETPQTQFQEEKEENQCINAFWTVLALNSRWAAVEGYGSSFPYWKPVMKVDTPWPWVSYL